jgi:glucose-1-phosphate adenylyltransferase
MSRDWLGTVDVDLEGEFYQAVIDRAIIDKNACIADGGVMTPEGKRNNFDGENYFIADGIVIVPKNAIIPVRFWI